MAMPRLDCSSTPLVEPRFVSGPDIGDDLDRKVFGVFGIPIDAVDLEETLRRVDDAIERRRTLFISTPNLNFLVTSWINDEFRDAMLFSDLCPPDGMPLVWMSRLLKLPIRTRVAGADIFDALKLRRERGRRAKAFFFGGAEGVAEAVQVKLNTLSAGMTCVGSLNPGFVSVEDMSQEHVISQLNSSRADLLAVFLNANKGQTWLFRNRDRLAIPVRAQFGATVNFQADKVKRAPARIRSWGLEWLWRIKEEPYLWRRYWSDGMELVALFSTCVLPLAMRRILRSMRVRRNHLEISAASSHNGQRVVVGLKGDAVADLIDDGIITFRAALSRDTTIEVDLSGLTSLDQRYLGLFLMVRKRLIERGHSLIFKDVPESARKIFALNKFSYLLAQESLP